MINVTSRLEAVKHHTASNITWVKLQGDEGFDWILVNHPQTPKGFIAIGGINNGSFRCIEKATFDKTLGVVRGTP